MQEARCALWCVPPCTSTCTAYRADTAVNSGRPNEFHRHLETAARFTFTQWLRFVRGWCCSSGLTLTLSVVARRSRQSLNDPHTLISCEHSFCRYIALLTGPHRQLNSLLLITSHKEELRDPTNVLLQVRCHMVRVSSSVHTTSIPLDCTTSAWWPVHTMAVAWRACELSFSGNSHTSA